MVARLARLLPGLWLGWLLCVATLATPAAFALLERAQAGRLAARMLAQEAATSVVVAAALLILHRALARRGGPQFGVDFGLVLAALFCTVAGYYGVLPLMEAARAGQGRLGFGALHAISSVFYGIKVVCVAVLAWRASRAFSPPPSS